MPSALENYTLLKKQFLACYCALETECLNSSDCAARTALHELTLACASNHKVEQPITIYHEMEKVHLGSGTSKVIHNK